VDLEKFHLINLGAWFAEHRTGRSEAIRILVEGKKKEYVTP